MKIKQLDELATNMVGDCGKSNVFFVSLGSNVQMITTNFDAAYTFWKELERNNRDMESTLEDRKMGTICDRSPVGETDNHLVTQDDSQSFRRRYRL